MRVPLEARVQDLEGVRREGRPSLALLRCFDSHELGQRILAHLEPTFGDFGLNFRKISSEIAKLLRFLLMRGAKGGSKAALVISIAQRE